MVSLPALGMHSGLQKVQLISVELVRHGKWAWVSSERTVEIRRFLSCILRDAAVSRGQNGFFYLLMDI